MISSLARIPKILSIMSIAAATHLIAHNNGLEGVPVAWLLIMKLIKNQLSKPPTHLFLMTRGTGWVGLSILLWDSNEKKKFNKKLSKFLSNPFFSDSLSHHTR